MPSYSTGIFIFLILLFIAGVLLSLFDDKVMGRIGVIGIIISVLGLVIFGIIKKTKVFKGGYDGGLYEKKIPLPPTDEYDYIPYNEDVWDYNTTIDNINNHYKNQLNNQISGGGHDKDDLKLPEIKQKRPPPPPPPLITQPNDNQLITQPSQPMPPGSIRTGKKHTRNRRGVGNIANVLSTARVESSAIIENNKHIEMRNNETQNLYNLQLKFNLIDSSYIIGGCKGGCIIKNVMVLYIPTDLRFKIHTAKVEDTDGYMHYLPKTKEYHAIRDSNPLYYSNKREDGLYNIPNFKKIMNLNFEKDCLVYRDNNYKTGLFYKYFRGKSISQVVDKHQSLNKLSKARKTIKDKNTKNHNFAMDMCNNIKYVATKYSSKLKEVFYNEFSQYIYNLSDRANGTHLYIEKHGFISIYSTSESVTSLEEKDKLYYKKPLLSEDIFSIVLNTFGVIRNYLVGAYETELKTMSFTDINRELYDPHLRKYLKMTHLLYKVTNIYDAINNTITFSKGDQKIIYITSLDVSKYIKKFDLAGIELPILRSGLSAERKQELLMGELEIYRERGEYDKEKILNFISGKYLELYTQIPKGNSFLKNENAVKVKDILSNLVSDQNNLITTISLPLDNANAITDDDEFQEQKDALGVDDLPDNDGYN